MIEVLPLGAGQDVGRSCIIVNMGGRTIMFDCGMHMGFNDARRFPDFTLISPSRAYDRVIDCVIISHFHLDHCGALPYFTEMCGFNGPIFMTHPTKALCPILLEDYRKIVTDREGPANFFTSPMIYSSLAKVRPVGLQESVFLAPDFEIKAYYAGHVLGAAMFWVRVGNESVVYTGDYNTTADRHLGAAWIERLRPDLLITETTYATTVRDSKRARERDFLKKVHGCVANGGKVLIPVFALGRAQELCILIESYWSRMRLDHIPVYFSAGLTSRANEYYRQFITWTNENLKQSFVDRNMFDFKHIREWEKHLADQPGPMVLFSSPGMLHSGTSLEVFRKWADNPLNMLIIPGYCVKGTIGAKVLAGKKQIVLDSETTIDVRLQVTNLSFSAHADAKGILSMIRQVEPKSVVLVHGEKTKMGLLKLKITEEFGLSSYDPPNGTLLKIETNQDVPALMMASIIEDRRQEIHRAAEIVATLDLAPAQKKQMLLDSIRQTVEPLPIAGILVAKDDGRPPRIIDEGEYRKEFAFASDVDFKVIRTFTMDRVCKALKSENIDQSLFMRHIRLLLVPYFHPQIPVELAESIVSVRSVSLSIASPHTLESKIILGISWRMADNTQAQLALSALDSL